MAMRTRLAKKKLNTKKPNPQRESQIWLLGVCFLVVFLSVFGVGCLVLLCVFVFPRVCLVVLVFGSISRGETTRNKNNKQKQLEEKPNKYNSKKRVLRFSPGIWFWDFGFRAPAEQIISIS